MRFALRHLADARHGWMKRSLKACAESSCKSLPSTALVRSSGRSSAWGWLSNGCMTSNLARRKSGGCWARWALAYKSQIGEQLSAMKTLCSVGNAARSRPLKKSPARRPSDCLCRRVRNQRTPDARSHLGAQGTDACHSISLQLESRLGYCWAYPHQLRIPTARWQHQEGTDRRISQGTESASEATSASDLGRFEATSQSIGSRLPRLPEWSYPDCVSSSLRSRIESGRISLGVAQTACLGQLLPKRPERVAPECPQQTQERAKASFDHCGLLDAGHALVMS